MRLARLIVELVSLISHCSSHAAQQAQQAATMRHHGVRGAHRGGDRPRNVALGEVLAVRREAGGLYVCQCSGAVPGLWRAVRVVHV